MKYPHVLISTKYIDYSPKLFNRKIMQNKASYFYEKIRGCLFLKLGILNLTIVNIFLYIPIPPLTLRG